MDSRFGCAHFSDDEFLHQFEQCQFAPGAFHHGDHVRLAWLYVMRYGAAAAEQRLLAGIRKMANHAGVPDKFMYTTTVAWVRLVAASRTPGESFETWIDRRPEFLAKNLLDRYYSSGTLESPEARAGWIEPDLKPLS